MIHKSVSVAAAAAGMAHLGRAHVSSPEALVPTSEAFRGLVGVTRRALAERPGLPTAEKMESARVIVPRR